MTNFSAINAPRLVYSPYGDASSRGTYGMVAIDSSAIYEGSFVSNMDVLGTSLAEGVRAFGDDDLILGVAQYFTKYNSSLPIKSTADGGAGTITAPTGILPLKYTFASTNGRADAARKLEMVQILPALPGDIWEVTLLNDGGTATANRGVTTGSDLEGYAMSLNTTSPFGLTESTSSLTTADRDAVTVSLHGRLPERLDRVYVQFLRLVATATLAES